MTTANTPGAGMRQSPEASITVVSERAAALPIRAHLAGGVVMNKRKPRPAKGEFRESMSIRDYAAALGMSKTELHRAMKLATIPKEEFERLLTVRPNGRAIPSERAILAEYFGNPSPRGDKFTAPKVARCPTCGRPA
jgi:hypothetical protein